VNEETAPDLKPIAFDLMFLFYDSLRVAVQQTINNVVLAGVAVFLLCMITLADIGGASLVLLVVVLTDVVLFGAMWYSDINSEYDDFDQCSVSCGNCSGLLSSHHTQLPQTKGDIASTHKRSFKKHWS